MNPFPEKYQTLLDADIWAYIKTVLSAYPEDPSGASVEQQRQWYSAMCKLFSEPVPATVSTVDEQVPVPGADPVPVRRYLHAEPDTRATIVFFHGGGFVVGDLDTHNGFCAELCARTGYTVVAVDYRLAPEHQHPAAFQDCLAVTRAACSEHERVLLCGDSAGGNFAAAVSRMARSGDFSIAGQVLLYPGLGGDTTKGSYVEHAAAPMLTLEEIRFFERVRLPEEYLPVLAQLQAGTPLSSLPPEQQEFAISMAPLLDTDFSGLPPTLCLGAACDPLHDDSEQYAAALTAAGGEASFVSETGLVHGYIRARGMSDKAAASIDRVIEFLQDAGTREQHPV